MLKMKPQYRWPTQARISKIRVLLPLYLLSYHIMQSTNGICLRVLIAEVTEAYNKIKLFDIKRRD